MATRFYWDTCVFIDLLQRTKDKVIVLDEIVRRAQNNEVVIITSALSIAEVAKLPQGRTMPEQQARRIREFFENPYIVVRPLDRAVAERASEIVRTQGLKPADAVHVATALMAEVGALHTYDKGVLGHAGEPWLGVMRIEEPSYPGGAPLFASGSGADS